MPRHRVGVLAAIVALAAPAPAQAGFGIGLDGIYHAGPHHWYTNDGHHSELSIPDVGDGHRDHEDHRAIHVHHKRDRDHGSRDWSLPHGHTRKLCQGYRMMYVARHGLTTPRSLRGEVGCRKWIDDAIYHDAKRDPLFPSIRAILTGKVNND